MRTEIPKPRYRSPLRTIVNLPSVVTYVCSLSGHTVGKVYNRGGKWFLSSIYLEDWRPFEIFTKYQGFLLLNSLHKKKLI
jgi:hypothetical protein